MKLKILAALVLVGALAACTTYGGYSSSNVFDPARAQSGGPIGSSGGGPN
jgi:hypothetical protein